MESHEKSWNLNFQKEYEPCSACHNCHIYISLQYMYVIIIHNISVCAIVIHTHHCHIVIHFIITHHHHTLHCHTLYHLVIYIIILHVIIVHVMITHHCLQLRDVSAELTQRDAVIKRLSDKLESTVDSRDSLQAEYVEQAAQLSGQVQLLQQQLKQVMDNFRLTDILCRSHTRR